MPHYNYECEACGYEFEEFHSMLAESLIDCPNCHQPKLIRLIGAGLPPIVKGTKNPCRGGRGNTAKKEKTSSKCRDRLGKGRFKGEKPFWRDGPVNKKVLENPKRYIKEGKVD